MRKILPYITNWHDGHSICSIWPETDKIMSTTACQLAHLVLLCFVRPLHFTTATLIEHLGLWSLTLQIPLLKWSLKTTIAQWFSSCVATCLQTSSTWSIVKKSWNKWVVLEEFSTTFLFLREGSPIILTTKTMGKKGVFIYLEVMEMTNETLETQAVFPANVVPDPATADVPTWLPLLVTPSTKKVRIQQLGFHQVMFLFVERKARSKKVTLGRFGCYQEACLKYIHILSYIM